MQQEKPTAAEETLCVCARCGRRGKARYTVRACVEQGNRYYGMGKKNFAFTYYQRALAILEYRCDVRCDCVEKIRARLKQC